MKITLTYTELSELVSNNTGKSVKFEFGGSKEEIIARIYSIPICVRILNVEPQSVTISYRMGGDSNILLPKPGIIVDPCPSPISIVGGLFKRGVNAVGNKALKVLVENCIKHSAIRVNEDKSVTVDMEKVPQLKAVVERMSLNSVSFNENDAIVEVAIK